MRNIRMAEPYFSAEDRAWIHRELDAILDGQLSMGPNVKQFEQEFAAMAGVRHAVALNSCTAALEIAIASQDVAGGEVIVPAETFIATGIAVHLAGGRPVCAEISAATLCLDLDDVKQRVNAATKGIILVHMGGLITPDIEDFVAFCASRGLFLIEDAAHAPGARLRGRAAGAFGLAGCFSFYPTKVITAGEGGMLTTDDDRVAAFARSHQHRGRDFALTGEQYALPGQNRRMTEMAALIGRVQLSHLGEFLARRQQIAGTYHLRLRDDPRVTVIVPDDLPSSACWKIPVVLPKGVDRPAVTDGLAQAGVAVDWAYQPAMHLQPVFRRLFAGREGDLPRTEDLLSRHICLPCHPRMTMDDANYVVDSLQRVLDSQFK